MFNQSLSHKKALKRINSYLKATRDKCFITRLSSEFKFEAFLDPEFADLYGYEKLDDPTCTKSITDFLLNVSGYPVLWIYNFQQEITLSTIGGEINILVHCCRKLSLVLDVVIRF
jgi:hypothetical protein